MPKNSELFEHTQRYIREVFAERLRAAGFSSYKGEDIHWYRLVNGQVVHAVYFITRHANLHSSMSIQYGCHPLFIPPIFQRSPYMYAMPGYEQMYHIVPEIEPGYGLNGLMGTAIQKSVNAPYRDPDVLIMCPQDEYHGLDILEQVLSVMDGLNTPEACYEAHKQWHRTHIEDGKWLLMSTYFVDEVLFWQDQELYPFCMAYVNGMSKHLEKVQRDGKLTRKADQADLARLQELKAIFENNALQEHLAGLKQAEYKTLMLLKKYAGIYP